MAIFGLFRPLTASLALLGNIGTTADICLEHCRRCIDGLEAYVDRWPLKEYSIMAVYQLDNVSLTLVDTR